MTVDVLVVGAGPAGCAAAARLAGGGARVAMLHRSPRTQRSCETLPGAAARLLTAAGLGPVDGLTEGRCRGTSSAWGTESLIAADGFASPDGPSWWVDRARFDAALRRRCAAAGVQLIDRPLRELHRDDATWRARLASDSELRTPWVVDATGRASAVARRLGAIRRHGTRLWALHATRAIPTAPTRLYLESAPDGWWYVGAAAQDRVAAVAVVGGDDARALASARRFGAQLGGTRHLARWAGDAVEWSVPSASPAGGAALDRVHGQGWVACGDAALAFDPLSSQGLVGALAGGLAAADAIAAADVAAALREIGNRHTDVASIYETRRAAAYARERRWADRPFWAAARHSVPLTDLDATAAC